MRPSACARFAPRLTWNLHGLAVAEKQNKNGIDMVKRVNDSLVQSVSSGWPANLNANIGRLLGAVQHQRELLQPSMVFVIDWSGFARLETHNKTPSAAWIFAPCVGGHEGPIPDG
jgi:hypothetical protein